jgi:hypothetical protein
MSITRSAASCGGAHFRFRAHRALTQANWCRALGLRASSFNVEVYVITASRVGTVRFATLYCAGAVLTGFVLLSGCGPTADAKKGAKVTGKIVMDGTPLESNPVYEPGKPNVRVTIGFVDDKGGGASGSGATVKADGTFESDDPVAPGTYRLTVMHFDDRLVPENKGSTVKPGQAIGKQSGPQSTNDRLKGKFNMENTTIKVTIPEGKSEHDIGTIDLAKQ